MIQEPLTFEQIHEVGDIFTAIVGEETVEMSASVSQIKVDFFSEKLGSLPADSEEDRLKPDQVIDALRKQTLRTRNSQLSYENVRTALGLGAAALREVEGSMSVDRRIKLSMGIRQLSQQ